MLASSWRLTIFPNTFLILHLCVCLCVCLCDCVTMYVCTLTQTQVTACMWRSENILQRSVLSCPMSSKHQTQVVRVGASAFTCWAMSLTQVPCFIYLKLQTALTLGGLVSPFLGFLTI